jgi:biopolymer transport protein ExbB
MPSGLKLYHKNNTELMQAVTDTVNKLTDTANHAAQQLAAIPTQELRFGDLLIKGGWVMIPIGILAVLGLVIFFERYFTIRKASKNESNLLQQVRGSIHSGNLESAVAICRNNNSPLGRMLQKGLLRIGRPIKDIEGAIENIGKLEVAKLEKNIGILGIVAGIAPMFGFLGTIAGVIKIFYDISKTDNISMGVISGGLYVKMVTSAAGLFVGIVAYVCYHVLNMMVDKVILQLETDAIEFIDLLEEPSK